VVAVIDQEVQVAALVGLQDVLDVEPPAPRRAVVAWGGVSAARRASSRSSTSRSSVPVMASSAISSPSRTSPMGPPTAASGVTCNAVGPPSVPLMRPSVTHTSSVMPALRSTAGIGTKSISGMPGAPTGPALRNTITLSGVACRPGSAARWWAVW
jgi:hypothetical protein